MSRWRPGNVPPVCFWQCASGTLGKDNLEEALPDEDGEPDDYDRDEDFAGDYPGREAFDLKGSEELAMDYDVFGKCVKSAQIENGNPVFLGQEHRAHVRGLPSAWQQMESQHGGFETRQLVNASTRSQIPTSLHGKVGEKTQRTSWKLSSWKPTRALVERRT
eukprot:s943_g16.t1